MDGKEHVYNVIGSGWSVWIGDYNIFYKSGFHIISIDVHVYYNNVHLVFKLLKLGSVISVDGFVEHVKPLWLVVFYVLTV